jgi:hypothetical protein
MIIRGISLARDKGESKFIPSALRVRHLLYAGGRSFPAGDRREALRRHAVHRSGSPSALCLLPFPHH